MVFANRTEAGRLLAERVVELDLEDPLVVGLPRGGVPVAEQVANALGAPLDVIVVRKLGAPEQPELGMGAVGPDGVTVVDEELVRRLGVSMDHVRDMASREAIEVGARFQRFRGNRPPPRVGGRSVVLVDDGIATGGTVRAAIRVLRRMGADHVVLAVPVAARASLAALSEMVDTTVCLESRTDLRAIGVWYEDFTQTTDRQVVNILERARIVHPDLGRPRPGAPNAAAGTKEVGIDVGPARLDATIDVPAGAHGVVVFAHGSGSGRHSPRNRYVAGVLREHGLATVLVDLLTAAEAASDERTREHRFDIGLLTERTVGVVDWLRLQPGLSSLAVGVIGSSTGASAALGAAARRPDAVDAVVCRGGRVDLAPEPLGVVAAPTLLIVGGDDTTVLELNADAYDRLGGESSIAVVHGATHLFEEEGAMEDAARLAAAWFEPRLVARAPLGREAAGGEARA